MRNFNYKDCGCTDVSQCRSNKKLKEKVSDLNYNVSLLNQMSIIRKNYM